MEISYKIYNLKHNLREMLTKRNLKTASTVMNSYKLQKAELRMTSTLLFLQRVSVKLLLNLSNKLSKNIKMKTGLNHLEQTVSLIQSVMCHLTVVSTPTSL